MSKVQLKIHRYRGVVLHTPSSTLRKQLADLLNSVCPSRDYSSMKTTMADLSPIPTAFTSVVASREFIVVRDSTSSPILFEIGSPIQDLETVTGKDWRCPVRISDGTTVDLKNACGVDSFQAMFNALRIVIYEIAEIGESCTVRLFDATYTADTYDQF